MRTTAFVLLATASCSHALAPTRNRLPTRTQRSTSASMEMRFGKKQLVYRSKVKDALKNVGSIDDLAEVISSDAFDLANRRMSSVLLVKVQKKASAMGYTIGVMTDEDEALYDELSEEELAAEFAAAEAGN